MEVLCCVVYVVLSLGDFSLFICGVTVFVGAKRKKETDLHVSGVVDDTYESCALKE